MSLTIGYTINAVDEASAATNLVFAEIASTPTTQPYPTKVTLTIGAKVYTFDTADLLKLAREISGT